MSIPQIALPEPVSLPGFWPADHRHAFQAALAECFEADAVTRGFGCAGSEVDPRHWESALAGMLREFVGRPGKGFRAIFTQACWEAIATAEPMPETLPVLVEALHTGSLIVDDIEDNATTRRGGPALHQVHGVGPALNAGNWLYFLPGMLIAQMDLFPSTEFKLHKRINETLFRAHAGQALDLNGRPDTLKQSEIPSYVNAMTRLKTGELFAFAASSAAIVGRASDEVTRALARFGRALGVALQMLDDLSTVTNPERRNKAAEDFANGRVTWAWAWAANAMNEVTFQRTVHMSQQPLDADGIDRLCLAFEDICRGMGRQHVCEQVLRAWDALPPNLADKPSIAALRENVIKLEKSYG
jgi:geranylgeranyl pyrophosphate synthase